MDPEAADMKEEEEVVLVHPENVIVQAFAVLKVEPQAVDHLLIVNGHP